MAEYFLSVPTFLFGEKTPRTKQKHTNKQTNKQLSKLSYREYGCFRIMWQAGIILKTHYYVEKYRLMKKKSHSDTSRFSSFFFIFRDMAATLALVISGRHIHGVSNTEAHTQTLFGYLCDRLVQDTRNSCPGLCEPK